MERHLRKRVRVLSRFSKDHQIGNIDDPNAQPGQILPEHRASRNNLGGNLYADTDEHDIRIDARIRRVLFPNRAARDAVLVGFLWTEPGRSRVLAAYEQVDVVATAETVGERRDGAVGVWGQVDARDVVWQVEQRVDQPGVLVTETVVLLAPECAVGPRQVCQQKCSYQ